MSGPKITLDQWAALVAVVDEGGYAQASRRLHRTQSTITYTVKKLEDLLGVKAFGIQGRKAVLTPAGEVLYRRGKSLVEDAARLERSAAGLGARLGAGNPHRRRHDLPDLAVAAVSAPFRRRASGHAHRVDRGGARRHGRGAGSKAAPIS